MRFNGHIMSLQQRTVFIFKRKKDNKACHSFFFFTFTQNISQMKDTSELISEILFCTGSEGNILPLSMFVYIDPTKENISKHPQHISIIDNHILDDDLEDRCYSIATNRRIPQFLIHDHNRQRQRTEIKKVIKTYLDYGFPEEEIINIIRECHTDEHIHIDRHLHIRLVDHDNFEIKLRPLEKTLYLFFIFHTEGVLINDLYKHKDELRKIYNKLTGRESKKDIEQSIQNLLNPQKNSIHEKLSNIKSAFRDNIPDTMIDDYTPSGRRGEVRVISVNREYITVDPEVKDKLHFCDFEKSQINVIQPETNL